jgi:hypothetical protein
MDARKRLPATVPAIFALTMVLTTTAFAEPARPDMKKPKDTVDRIRKPDPPPIKDNTVVRPERPKPQMPRGGSDVERMRKNPPPPPPK